MTDVTRRQMLGAAGGAAFVAGFPPIPDFDANNVGRTGVTEIDGYVVVQTGGIKSANWQQGVRGWSIDGDGDAEFNDLTIRGDVIASVWDGGLDLSGGADGTATVGFFLDSSAGAAQFQEIYAEGGELGDLTITGQLSLPAGGSLKSTTIGGTELSDTQSLLRYTSGNTFDVRLRGDSLPQIQASTSGVTIAGGPTTITGTLDLTGATISSGSVSSPAISGSDSDSGIYFSGATTAISYNGSQKLATQSTGISVNGTLSAGPVSTTGLVTGGGGFRSSISGGASAPAFAFSSDIDLGMFRAGANDGRLAAGGASIAQFTTGRFGPGSDDAISLGASGLRWTAVWAVNGTIQTSDRRTKKDIQPLSHAMAKLLQLRPVTFRWKDGDDRKIRMGVIGQEAAVVFDPDEYQLVSVGSNGDVDDFHSVSYHELIAPTVAAVQELHRRLAIVEGKVG